MDAMQPPAVGRDIDIRVLEHVNKQGVSLYYERYETELSLDGFEHDESYKQNCEGCRKHGRNLACPPYSPTFARYAAGAAVATIIYLRMPLEFFDDELVAERYDAAYQTIRPLLVDELIAYRNRGHRVAGSGACHACKECAVEYGDKRCKKPDERIYSLESLGVNVVALVRDAFGIDLEWSAGEQTATFVSAVGAVFSST